MILNKLNQLLAMLEIEDNHLPELTEIKPSKGTRVDALDLEKLKKKNYSIWIDYKFNDYLETALLDLGYFYFDYTLNNGDNEYLQKFYLTICNIVMNYSNYLQFLIKDNKQEEIINEHFKKLEIYKDVLFELNEKLLKEII